MKSKVSKILACACMSGSMIAGGNAQTVLSGDHVIEGDLNIGTSGQRGSLVITGETGNSASPGIKVIGDGGFIFEGSPGLGMLPALTSGKNALLWYPKKGALKMGTVDSSWSIGTEIGEQSVAFPNSRALGKYSVAMSGGSVSLNSSYSMALGSGRVTLSSGSTAIGGGFVEAGYASVAIGFEAQTYGNENMALVGGLTTGTYSLAMTGGVATGWGSVAMNGGLAAAVNSLAIGMVESLSASCVVVGSYNATSVTEEPDDWVPDNPIFVVGNGENADNRSNAFVILKNGNVEMMAKVKMPRQGDILMGEFGE